VNRAALALTVGAAGCLALAGALHANDGYSRDKRGGMRFASPGRIVGAEVAFSQLAQKKGQWTAFRETAAEGAVMFVPQPVDARKWLKGRQDPPRAVTWQPHQVWVSCDGSLAVSYGAWQGAQGGASGYFTTVWQRQKNGDYKWVMDQGDDLKAPLEAPDMIGGNVAFCARREGSTPRPARAADNQPKAPPPAYFAHPEGKSDDGTLAWSISVDAQCGRSLTVSLDRGAGNTETVLTRHVAGTPGASCTPT